MSRTMTYKSKSKQQIGAVALFVVICLLFLSVFPTAAETVPDTDGYAAETAAHTGVFTDSVQTEMPTALSVDILNIRIGKMNKKQSSGFGVARMFDGDETTSCAIGIATFSRTIEIYFRTSSACTLTDCTVSYEDNGGRSLIWTLLVKSGNVWLPASGGVGGAAVEYKLEFESVDRSLKINEITLYGRAASSASGQSDRQSRVPQTGDIALLLTTAALVCVTVSVVCAKYLRKKREKE